MPAIHLSLIVPTRERPDSLRRLLASLTATATDLARIEVVLVVDEDAIPRVSEVDPRLAIRMVVVPPGQTMGALNVAGADAARGDFLMLLNDDVLAQTRGWDARLVEAARQFHDGIVLVHVNDTLMRHHLCTFPLLSRIACRLMGTICPREYIRYRIDDHIADIFTLLGVLGERRMIYLPEVVFEHTNAVELPCGVREYHADPEILALDAPRFDHLQEQRKQAALTLLDHIETHRCARRRRLAEARLDALPGPLSRNPARLRVAPACHREVPARVSLIILTDDLTRTACRDSLHAITVNASWMEVIVLPRGAGSGLARRLNELCQWSPADYLAIVDDSVRLPVGWLDRMLACMQPDVAVVTPLVRRAGATVSLGGLVFAPDGSGHHSAWTTPLPGIVPAFTFCSPVVLLDRAKIEQILFDESYDRYFIDCDLGLRCWEHGWQVIVTPDVTAEVLGNGPLPYPHPLDEIAFDTDRRRFVALWMESGRFDRLRLARWEGIASLRHWLALADTFRGTGNPGLSALAAARHCPILSDHLQPRPAIAQPGRLTGLVHRLRRCCRDKGILGLARAGVQRIVRLLAWGRTRFWPRPVQTVANPTREAAQRMQQTATPYQEAKSYRTSEENHEISEIS